MSRQITELTMSSIQGNMALLKKDINSCPENLWEKEVGGFVYWKHVFHVLNGMYSMLPTGEKLESPIPPENGRFQNDENNQDFPHDKETMLGIFEEAKKHIVKYFNTIDDSNLTDTVDFFGTPMPLLTKLNIVNGHVMYHLGVIDGAHREAGIVSAI